MKKEKKYGKIKFSVETITAALKEFRRTLKITKSKESIICLSIDEGRESWDFDKKEDFFRKYQTTNEGAFFAISIGGFSFSLYLSGGETRVTIGANEQEDLDHIFLIFDEAAAKYTQEHSILSSPRLSLTNYSITKRLPSCLVSVNFLLEIEKSLLPQIEEILQLPKSSISIDYSISIDDSLGTHNLKSISELGSTMFIDNTSEVRCGVSRYSGNRLELSFCFNKQRSYSKLTISVSSHEPRAKVAAIIDLVTRILHPHTLSNHIFHPPEVIGYIAPTIIGLSIIIALYLPFHFKMVLLGIVTLLIFYYLVARPLFPYSEFDSKIYRTKSHWTSWFVVGILGFLIFGTLFPLLRKLFFGY